MADVKVDTLHVDSVTVDIFFDGKQFFYADLFEERLQRPSIERLKDLIVERVRAGALEVEVPVSLVEYDSDKGADGVEIEDVVLIRLERRRGRPVYRSADGRVDVYQGWSNHVMTKRLSAESRATIRRLRQAVYDAEQAWTRWVERMRLEDEGRTLLADAKAQKIAEKLATKATDG